MCNRVWRYPAGYQTEGVLGSGRGPGPCDCCGDKRVHHQERVNHSQAPSGEKRKICKRCYYHAVQTEAGSNRALRGLLNRAGMIRTNVVPGRYQVCNGKKAIWRGEEARVTEQPEQSTEV